MDASPSSSQSGSRYGCHECREDLELVLSGRTDPSVRERYDAHLGSCADCRRYDRVLEALYRGPTVPGELSGARADREFETIVARMDAPSERRVTQRIAMPALAAAAAAAAVVFAVSLWRPGTYAVIDRSDQALLDGEVLREIRRGDLDDRTASVDLERASGGIDHPAQSYGRIVGGSARMLGSDGVVRNSDTFGIGTRFLVGSDESVQVGLAGKLVANLTPGSGALWTAASPKAIEIDLQHGMIAIRYDRRPSDPILAVRTPSAIVRVVGTVFTVEVDPAAGTTVSVLRGEVEVLDPTTRRLLAEVEAGSRYDVRTSAFSDVGRLEVAAALPLSTETPEDSRVTHTRVPDGWMVPGLPAASTGHRTLAYVPDTSIPGADDTAILRLAAPTPRRANRGSVVGEGDDLIARLMADVEATRNKELRDYLDRCRALYRSPETRYFSARCVSEFMQRYERHPLAVEGYLLVGLLRMDYALDYRAAEVAFQEFLKHAPDHPNAEFATYRMWLAATEDGRITQAIRRARLYLQRYPHGKHVGKILQRFPELKDEL